MIELINGLMDWNYGYLIHLNYYNYIYSNFVGGFNGY